MPVPVCFDISHIVARLGIDAPTGIDKVDLAYARHFAARGTGPGVHYGGGRPRVLEPAVVSGIVARADAHSWQATSLDGDAAWRRVAAVLEAGAEPRSRSQGEPQPVPRKVGMLDLGRRRWRLWRQRPDTPVPAGALYLNIAQFMLEEPRHLAWLERRPDVRGVLFIHDLLPLDVPELFRPTERDLFDRRIATALRFGTAFIVSTESVAARLREEAARRGVVPAPIHVAPLPSTLTDRQLQPLARQDEPALAARPYFVIVGTIEPRKNHLLLLNVWRSLVEQGVRVPRLVIVGARGWGNAQVLDVLDRSEMLRPHLVEVAGLSASALVTLLSNARALLMPSFDEGYGLPLVEALTIGTPVIATDKPVFREVTQSCAIYRHYLDGQGWKDAILALAESGAGEPASVRADVARFKAPTWPVYFERLEAFLAQLATSGSG